MYCTEGKQSLPTLAQCCPSMPDLIPVEPFQFLCAVLSVLQWSGCLHNSAIDFSSYNQYYLTFLLTSVSHSAPHYSGQQKVNQTFNVMQSNHRSNVFFLQSETFQWAFQEKIVGLLGRGKKTKKQTQTELRLMYSAWVSHRAHTFLYC